MAGHSLEFWQEKWNDIFMERTNSNSYATRNSSGMNAMIAVDLLAMYSGFFKHLPPGLGVKYPWGGYIVRFFSGKWNHHHGNSIQRAIAPYFRKKSIEFDPKNLNVEYVLSLVKGQLNDRPINLKGDLAKIIQVIKEITEVDYFSSEIETRKPGNPESIEAKAKETSRLLASRRK